MFVGVCGVPDVVDMTSLGATAISPYSVVQERA